MMRTDARGRVNDTVQGAAMGSQVIRHGRRTFGNAVILAWGALSMVGHTLSDSDVAQTWRLVFPGAVLPDAIGPLDISSMVGSLYATLIGDFVRLDLLTVGMMLLAAGGLVLRTRGLALFASGLAVLHVVMFGVYGVEGGIDEFWEYLGVIPLFVGALLALSRVTTLQAQAQVPMPSPMGSAAVSGWPVVPPPVASPWSGSQQPSISTPQYCVQTPSGVTDWLSYEQLLTLVRDGVVQATTPVLHRETQTSIVAGSIPGLFSS